jgi:hypothetical protein
MGRIKRVVFFKELEILLFLMLVIGPNKVFSLVHILSGPFLMPEMRRLAITSLSMAGLTSVDYHRRLKTSALLLSPFLSRTGILLAILY